MKDAGLSYNTRKALVVNIGEDAGSEIAELIAKLCSEIEDLRKNKVDVIEIAPRAHANEDLAEKSA